MSQRAMLEGVPGVVDLHFHLSSGVDGEWRGTFRADDEDSVTGMVGKRPLTLETRLEEEGRSLPVVVTAFGADGTAVFRTRSWSIAVGGPAAITAGAGKSRRSVARRPSRNRGRARARATKTTT